ncbi:MAG TPA: M56 family metallopeptidase [Mucilaginibacter sp.]|jgi:hypothetical protein
MIPYILHVAILITVCLLFYKLLLQKETFYRLNRWVLVFCLALSFVIPLVPVPQQWALLNTSKTTEETVQPAPFIPAQQNSVVQTQPEAKPAPTAPSLQPVAKTTETTAAKETSPSTFQLLSFLQHSVKWLFYLYWIGVAAFGLNLLLQLIVLLFQAYTKPAIIDGRFRIIELTGDKAPCSFGNNIFINPEKYDWETYSQILLHEKIHIEQRHSFDILMAELVLVLQWFNPFAWLYRTELESNLEFLTDNSVLEHKEIERSSYQMSLLKVSAPHLSLGITTNYNQSLLKKRILMMNAKKSNIHIMWKYFFLVPLLGILACALNDTAAYSHPVAKAKTNTNNYGNYAHWINHTATEGTWFANIKLDKIRIEFRSDSDDRNWSSNSDFKVSEFSPLPKTQKGDFTLTREAGTILFNGKFDGDQGYGHYKFTADKQFKAFLGQHGITNLEEGDDFAFFIVNIKRDYLVMLENDGYKGLSKNDLISMGALKVDDPYIHFWKSIGYPNLTTQQLVSGKALGINAEYVSEIRKAGYTHLTFEQLVSFKATGVNGKFISGLHGVNPKTGKPGNVVADTMPAEDVVSVKALNIDAAYISSLQKAGYSNIPINELTSMKAVGVTPQYIEELSAAGYQNIPPRELVSMKSVGVTPAYVKSLAVIGYTGIPARELTSLRAVGVAPEYVASLKSAGYNNIKVNDLVSMKSVGATPEFAKGFVTLGYNNIPARDLISMRSVGVTPEFVQSFKAAGYTSIALRDLVSLRAMGITPDYAKGFENVGYKNIPVRELTSLKSLGITPDYIKGFQDAGYTEVSINSFSGLKATGVTPDFIEGFKKIGYDNITLNEATSLKANGITPAYVSEMRDKGFKSQNLNKYIELKNAFN